MEKIDLTNPAVTTLLGACIGGTTAILGGIIGGWVQGRAWYHFEQKRLAAERKGEWKERALHWEASGGGYSLRNADLENVSLVEIRLQKADLIEANLYKAQLQGANFFEAKLRRANLSEANLSGANLKWADLRWANLKRTNLQECILVGAKLNEANLKWGNLSEAQLFEAKLAGATLRNANLSGATLAKADLSKADLSGANLSDISWGKTRNDAERHPNNEDCPDFEGVLYTDETVWPDGFLPPAKAIRLSKLRRLWKDIKLELLRWRWFRKASKYFVKDGDDRGIFFG